MTLEDNLWILDEYGLDRNWLHPAQEQIFMWPQKSTRPSINQLVQSFAKDDRRYIFRRAAQVAASIPATELAKLGHIRVRIEQHDSYYIPCIVTTDASRLGYDDETDIIDANSSFRTRIGSRKWDRLVRLSFCSLRFDDMQHVILALDGQRIIDEAWTVEEVYFKTTRILLNRIRFSTRRAVFLFDRSEPLLAPSSQRKVALSCRLALKHVLPDDVVNIVTDKVIEDSDGLTFRRFFAGDAAGTFHYGIARLLRVGWHASMNVPSLRDFANMDERSRRKLQPVLNSIIRRRHCFFARKLSNKTTRSGHVY